MSAKTVREGGRTERDEKGRGRCRSGVGVDGAC